MGPERTPDELLADAKAALDQAWADHKAACAALAPYQTSLTNGFKVIQDAPAYQLDDMTERLRLAQAEFRAWQIMMRAMDKHKVNPVHRCLPEGQPPSLQIVARVRRKLEQCLL